MKQALENIVEVVEGVKRVRKPSCIESAILLQAQKGLTKKTYTRKEVLTLLNRQIARSAKAVERMPACAPDTNDEEAIIKKLRNIKPITF